MDGRDEIESAQLRSRAEPASDAAGPLQSQPSPWWLRAWTLCDGVIATASALQLVLLGATEQSRLFSSVCNGVLLAVVGLCLARAVCWQVVLRLVVAGTPWQRLSVVAGFFPARTDTWVAEVRCFVTFCAVAALGVVEFAPVVDARPTCDTWADIRNNRFLFAGWILLALAAWATVIFQLGLARSLVQHMSAAEEERSSTFSLPSAVSV